MTPLSLSGWILLFSCVWSNLHVHCTTMGETSSPTEQTHDMEDPAENRNSTCSISILSNPDIFTSPLYQLNGTDIGSTFVTFSVSPNPDSPSSPCYISTDTIVEELSFIHGVVHLYLILECSANIPLRIQAANQSELDRQERTLMTLHIRRCVLDVADVGLIGQICRLHAILLKDTTMTEDTPRDMYHAEGFSQLRTLVFVYSLWPAPIEALPLNSSYFFNISKLTLQGVNMKGFPDYIPQNYPNLLSLTLISCSLEHPPDISLDNASPEILPLGLSLTKKEVYRKFQNGIYQSPTIVPRVLKLVYNNFRDLSSYTFRGILHSLVLNNNRIRVLGEDAFSSVKGLQSIHLSGNILRSLPEKVFFGLDDLILVDLSQNGLSVLHQNQFKGLKNLRIINLEANALTSIHVDTFSHLPNIAFINIGWNKLKWLVPGTLPVNSPYFVSIDLGKNPLEHVSSELFFTNSLKRIDLSYTGISFDQILDDLDNITHDKLIFSPGNDPYSNEKPILNLGWNNIRSFPTVVKLEKPTPVEMDRNLKLISIMNHFCVDLTGNELQCNCDLGLAVGILGLHQVQSYDAQKGGPVPLDWNTCYRGWSCGGPGLLRGVPVPSVNPLLLYCPLNTSACPKHCDCNIDFSSNVTVDCSGKNLDSFVETLPKGATKIHLQGNNIKKIPSSLMPGLDKVKTLVLSNNSIQELTHNMFTSLPELTSLYLDGNNLSRLPKVLNKTHINIKDLKLSGNSFPCDCDNKWMKQWLLHNKAVVQDWDSVECKTLNNTFQPMVSTDDSAFGCPPQPVDDTSQIVTLSVVLGGTVLLLVLFCYFHKQLRACVFVHVKLSTCGKQMAPLSLFLVNSREDETWVETRLTSVVRKYPNCEKVVSIRDFMPGFPTKDNILMFLQNNSVTVLILSQAFFSNDICIEILKILSEHAGKPVDGRIVVVIKDSPVMEDIDYRTALDDVCTQSLVINADTCAFRELVIHAVLSSNLSAPRHVKKVATMNRTYDEPPVVVSTDSVRLDDLVVGPFLYDVSMMYGDSDTGLVLGQLLPQLTGHGYRVGIPDREFLPGSDHAENIESLLTNSRKVVFFLSESLVRDEWSSFAFKLATDLKSSHGSNYLFVVLGDDVQKDTLDGDILVYTENHVCLTKDQHIGTTLLKCLNQPSGLNPTEP
ncbi:uncharacterized protein LOC135467859 isoform X2 [Liolophura sinensis]